MRTAWERDRISLNREGAAKAVLSALLVFAFGVAFVLALGAQAAFAAGTGAAGASEGSVDDSSLNANTDGVGPSFKDYSVSLGAQIGLNFYLDVPQDITEGSMAYAITGKGEVSGTSALADAPRQTDGTCKFTAYVNTLQMAETLTATFSWTDTDGQAQSISKNVSVSAYLNDLPAQTESASPRKKEAALNVLAKRMADVGHCAQRYLKDVHGFELLDVAGASTTGCTAMARIDSAVIPVPSNLATYALVNPDSLKSTHSLVLDSETAVKIYFKEEDADPSKVT